MNRDNSKMQENGHYQVCMLLLPTIQLPVDVPSPFVVSLYFHSGKRETFHALFSYHHVFLRHITDKMGKSVC